MGSTGQVYHHLHALVAAGLLEVRSGGRHEVPADRLVLVLAAVMGART